MDQLPVELIQMICSHLRVNEMVALRATCRRTKAAVDGLSARHVWITLCTNHLSGPGLSKYSFILPCSWHDPFRLGSKQPHKYAGIVRAQWWGFLKKLFSLISEMLPLLKFLNVMKDVGFGRFVQPVSLRRLRTTAALVGRDYAALLVAVVVLYTLYIRKVKTAEVHSLCAPHLCKAHFSRQIDTSELFHGFYIHTCGRSGIVLKDEPCACPHCTAPVIVMIRHNSNLLLPSNPLYPIWGGHQPRAEHWRKNIIATLRAHRICKVKEEGENTLVQAQRGWRNQIAQLVAHVKSWDILESLAIIAFGACVGLLLAVCVRLQQQKAGMPTKLASIQLPSEYPKLGLDEFGYWYETSDGLSSRSDSRYGGLATYEVSHLGHVAANVIVEGNPELWVG